MINYLDYLYNPNNVFKYDQRQESQNLTQLHQIFTMNGKEQIKYFIKKSREKSLPVLKMACDYGVERPEIFRKDRRVMGRFG